jgi:hypothetical protein
MIKMDIKKQLNEFRQIVKAPPIENPRKERKYPNDNMSDKEVEELFEKIVDPAIIEAERRDSPSGFIPLKTLGMSPKFAGKKAKQFYGDKGYGKIYTNDVDLWIYF